MLIYDKAFKSIIPVLIWLQFLLVVFIDDLSKLLFLHKFSPCIHYNGRFVYFIMIVIVFC